jgi:hypothetical protein
MIRACQLPLVTSPTISNVKVPHVQMDSGAALSVMSLHAFHWLQIPISKLTPSRLFDRIGKDPI